MKVLIDDRTCDAEYGEYILAVAKRNGIDIPNLCHSDALAGLGTCRLCVVEIMEEQKTKVVASCIYPITHELEIKTDSSRIFRIRKTIMKLLLSRAPENACLNSLARQYGLQPSKLPDLPDKAEDCILCGLCVKACEKMGTNAISTVGRGTGKKVSTPYDEPSAACVGCGSCAAVCPTGVIGMEDKNGTRAIWGKTFEMLRCEKCGHYIAPKEYLGFMEKKLGQKLDCKYCSSCRKAIYGSKYRDIFNV
ncbi:MAG: 2Fe-2S iron-sulfur cluster-binding protein [Clostridia bacterium]